MSDADDRLLDDLARVLGRVDLPPEHVVEAAKAAIEVRGLDAELAALVVDDAEELVGAGTRSAAFDVEVEPLVFELDEVVIEVVPEGGSVEVQVVPTGVMPLVVRAGSVSVEVTTDVVGRAVVELPDGRPLRVEAEVDGRRIVTDWFLL